MEFQIDPINSVEIGYIILTRPCLRERITSVYDTANKCPVAVYKALRRGIIGFAGDLEDEAMVRMSEKEQKKLFYAFDTAKQKRLTFKEAIRGDIIQYDSSKTDSTMFPEFAE